MNRIVPLLLSVSPLLAMAEEVRWQRLPAGGRQPQIAIEADGTAHMTYLNGDSKESDVWYRRRGRGETDFSEPVRVNDVTGTAIQLGTIRGAQIAVSGDGIVHIAWNGGPKARKQAGKDALYYARMKKGDTRFESAKNLLGDMRNLDGGASIAADASGNVAVVWHANPPAGPADELHRSVFAAISTNSGSTFSEPRILNRDATGACGCCALSAAFRSPGQLQIIYRAAFTGMDRDVMNLSGPISSPPWTSTRLEAWKVGMCPMSTSTLGKTSDGGYWNAWEAGDRVTFAKTTDTAAIPFFKTPAGHLAKHPRLATNAKNESLCVWTEDTGWARGGRVQWQLLDPAGKELGSGHRDDLPAWDFAAVIPDRDDGFLILY